jgi:hypothetical protein
MTDNELAVYILKLEAAGADCRQRLEYVRRLLEEGEA